MLNIVCHITNPMGKTIRCTVKVKEETNVQNLIDRIESRFENIPTKIQRNDRVSNEPAHILFFDEPIEPGDEFFFSFEPETLITDLFVPNDKNGGDLEKMPQLLPAPQPLVNSSPHQHSLTPQPEASPKPLRINEFRFEPEKLMDISPSLSNISVNSIVNGYPKAEAVVAKLDRCEPIEPGERQLLVRIAGRWLMEHSATKMKPTSAERAFFTREFFGKLPNFKYDMADFHNSQSRGFLDVFIYNERDRKQKQRGETNRPDLSSEIFVRTLKRKYRAESRDDSGPFPVILNVPDEGVTQLTQLNEDIETFEIRFNEILTKEFGTNSASERMAENWEQSIAPKILRYVQKINPEFYHRTVADNQLTDEKMSILALNVVPFLVRRLHRENSNKLSYLLAKVDNTEDECILKTMRERGDPGPVIFTDGHRFRIVVTDKIIPCEQTAAFALEKLLKAFYVYQLPLSQLRRAMVTLILSCFGIARKSSSCFKEVVNCIMSIT